MKLLLRRDQRATTFGKPIFTLDVRAEMTDEEISNIKKYRLKDLMLLFDSEKNLTVYVHDVMAGKHIEYKDIRDMLWFENQLKEMGRYLNQILKAAASFGGEEVVDLAA